MGGVELELMFDPLPMKIADKGRLVEEDVSDEGRANDIG